MAINLNLALFLLSATAITLSGVMMPGPVTAITVARGQRDKYAGVFIALGHGVVEIPVMAAIYFGLAPYFSLPWVKTAVALGGGLVLVYMGLATFRASGKGPEVAPYSPYGSFAAGVITSALNPGFFLWWVTVGSALIMGASAFGLLGILLFVPLHWLCDLGWEFALSWSMFRSRRFWTPMKQRILLGACAAVLAGFGLWFIVSAL